METNEPRDGTVAIDGRSVAHRRTGPSGARRVLWIDGTPGSRIPWVVADEEATRLGLELLTFDRPGYGDSSPHPGRTIVDVARDAEVVLDAVGWERCDVVGVSGGGPFALALAACAPDRVDHVLCFGSAAPNRLDHDGLAEEQRAGLELLRDDPAAYRAELDAMVEAIHADPVATMAGGGVDGADLALIRRPGVVDRFAASMRLATRQGAEGWYADQAGREAGWSQVPLEDVAAPVVFVHGSDDGICPPAATRVLAADLGATMEVVAGGHLSILDGFEDAVARHW